MELLASYHHIIPYVAAFLLAAPVSAALILRKRLVTLKAAPIIIGFYFGLALTCVSLLTGFRAYLGGNIGGLESNPSGLTMILIGMLGCLILASSSLGIFIYHLPKKQTELKRLKKNAKVFQHSYKKVKNNFIQQSTELEALSSEIENLYQNQYQSEARGSASIELYRRLFDTSPIFYIALSPEGDIDDINDSACRALKYSFAELVSSHFLDIISPEDRYRVSVLLDSFSKPDSIENTFETVFRDQKRNTLSVTVMLKNFRRGDTVVRYLFCQDVTESRSLASSLAFQATHDDLTQLLNRRALEQHFENRKNQAISNKPVSLIYFDLDQLKVVNDTCGHIAGDQLLKQLVAILKPVCEERTCNIFARIGGDEFAIVTSKPTKKAVNLLAETLRSRAEDLTFVWENKPFRQSISVGVAYSSNPNATLKELLSVADAACYLAKEQGRNQVKVNIVEDTNTAIDHRQSMHWVSRLDKAVRNGEFSLNFQPIVRVDRPSSPYIHYEVLLQYIDEKGNKISPGNFLPSAERFGKSTEIDLWVVTETFDFLRRNTTHTKYLGCCSINLTSHSIASHRCRSAIISLVKTHSFPPGKICFEITETSAISNLGDAIEFIQTLRGLGCLFALDDFGTGFSSFGYLRSLKVDYVKIDGSFIRNLTENRFDKVMTQSICNIAKEMGIKTVAEYVESDRVMRELKAIGIDFGQGFAIAKPMPLEAIDDFYHGYDSFMTK